MMIDHLRRRSLAGYAVVALAAACGEAGPERNTADPPSADAIRESHRIQHMIDPARGGNGGELPEQTSFLRIDLQAGIGAIVLTNAEDVDAAGLAVMMIDAVSVP